MNFGPPDSYWKDLDNAEPGPDLKKINLFAKKDAVRGRDGCKDGVNNFNWLYILIHLLS